MKKFVKIIALVLAIVSLMAVAMPALAAADQTLRTTCKSCGKTATTTRYYSRETVNYDERKYENGAHYIRWNMKVPTKTVCSSNNSHTVSGSINYFTAWQFMGY